MKNISMTNERRDLIHKVMDGHLKILPTMHALTHYRHCDNFLKWLDKNRIRGIDLEQWLQTYFNNSVMSMVKFIIKTNEKNQEYKPIVLNQDWVK